jgi:hypothetical protein
MSAFSIDVAREVLGEKPDGTRVPSLSAREIAVR